MGELPATWLPRSTAHARVCTISRSVRNRILLPYLALIVALLAGTGLVAGRWAAALAREQILDRGRGIAETLRRSSFPFTDAVLHQLKGLGGAEFVLVDRDGLVQASTLRRVPVSSRLKWSARPGEPLFQASWQAYRVGAVERGESERLLILLPEQAIQAAAWEAWKAVALFSLVGTGLSIALAVGLGRTLTRPISQIGEALRQVGQGELEALDLPTRRGDEIGELARALDQTASRLRQYQEERIQNERLQLIRQVSAGLAHELRNPLTAVQLTLELFQTRNRGFDIEPLKIAQQELARMERLIKGFLRVARPDPPRLGNLHIEPLIEAALGASEAMALHRGSRLAARVEPDMPPLLADADQMPQVLSNLIRNALEAAGPGGRVEVRAAPSGEGLVAIDVEDDGPGVPASLEQRLFEPFQTTKPEGVGLGLAICRAIAHDHGGTLTYCREAGRSRFRLLLPAARADAPQQSGPAWVPAQPFDPNSVGSAHGARAGG